ncbi:MAG: MFS transporter [Coriobacteriales bacterium]|jgi:nitrate/nitrite transporter NarK
MQEKVEYSGYRWVILFLFAAVSFMVSFCQFQPAYFAEDIMSDFSIGTTEFSLITSAPMIVGIFLALFGGAISDRFGIKKIVLIGLIISAAGALWRYWCGNFITLFLAMALTGTGATFVTANVSKMAIAWFKPKEISIAVAISLSLGMMGIAVAQATTGAMFSDYSSAFLVGGIAMAVLMVLWAIFGRDRAISPQEGEVETVSIKKSLKKVVRIRNLWFAGIATLLFNGFNVCLSSFLTTGLISVWGVDSEIAGLLASFTTWGSVIGATFLPTVIIRFRHAKVIYSLAPFLAAVFVFAGWSINVLPVRSVLFLLAGILYGCINPLAMLYPSTLPEVSSEISGTAGGFITMLMMAGSVIVPSFIVTPIAGSNYMLLVAVDCIVLAFASVMFLLLPSLSIAGNKKR